MGRGRVLRGLLALTLLPGFMAACGDDDDAAEATTTTEAEAEAQEIDVSAIDYAFQGAPAELEAGVVTVNFTNEGEVDHEFALIESGDTPMDEFLPEFQSLFIEEGAPFPAETEHVAVPIQTSPGDEASATFLVAEGTYVLLCALEGDAEDAAAADEGDEGGEEGEDGEDAPTDPAKIHFNRGMAQVLTVNPGSEGALPESDGTITAHDYTFDVDVQAGDETINFINTGAEDQVHFAEILEFPEGTTSEQALASFAAFTSEGPPPEGLVEPSDDEFDFTGVFSLGLGNHRTPAKQFKSGYTYLLACFISDRAGGPPHALPEDQGGHGMVKVVTIE